MHALISVSDKTGIVEFAKELVLLGVTILSTDGTAKLLKTHGITVIDVCDFTGFPEIMNGRVKTLHPKIYAGILARPQDRSLLEDYQIPEIGLLVVNLYPFSETISKLNCTLQEAIEKIDIGGPCLLRAGAKNYETTTVITEPEDYALVLSELRQNGRTSLQTRFKLAQKVFAHTARYDQTINHYFLSKDPTLSTFPEILTLQYDKKADLRYGENPHQKAAYYVQNQQPSSPGNLTTAVQQSGKPLSYNNILDADTALQCIKQFQQVACVIVKHANPCSVAISHSPIEAYKEAYRMDSESSFGGILAFNRELDEHTLQTILDNQFVEVIIVPSVTREALNVAQKKPNVRILSLSTLNEPSASTIELRSVSGGLLVQDSDYGIPLIDFHTVSKRHPTEKELADAQFAWQVVKMTKSNAIVIAKNLITLGIGAGQMSRVFSTKIAALKANAANTSMKGAVMASDAFFPFRDSIDTAASFGITTIIQPGGSIRDQEVIEAADEHNLAMIFTYTRHFRH